MKTKITAEQMRLLLEAAARAKDPGACRYVKDGEPCCVIAQLAALNGADLDVIGSWDCLDVETDEDGHLTSDVETDEDGHASTAYSEELAEAFCLSREWDHRALRRVQSVWDRGYDDPDEARCALVDEIQLVFEVAP